MDKEIAVVVGVGPGLGWALVKRFADAGMDVVAAARDVTKLQALTRSENLHVRTEPCDATKPAHVDRLFSHVGVPRVVVFNAGGYERGGILELSPEGFEQSWRVGCFGGFLVGQAAARLMVPAQAGSILFTGATASLRGGAGFAGFAMSKFGLRAVAQSMARELGPKGIHVAHVIIDGQIERGSDARLSPEDIAEQYYLLHRQPRSAWTQELDLRPWVEKF